MFMVDQSRRASFQAEMDVHAESLWSVALWLTMRWSAADKLLLKTVSKAYGLWPVSDKSVSHKAWFFGVLAGEYLDDRSMRPGIGTLLPIRTRDFAAESNGQDRDRTTPLDSEQLATLVRLPDASIKGAVARLSPETRLLLLLRFREKLSYSDIAYITGLREDEVKSWLSNLRYHTPRYILRQTDRIGNSPDHGNGVGPERDRRSIPMSDLTTVFGEVERADRVGDAVVDSVSNLLPGQSPGHEPGSSL